MLEYFSNMYFNNRNLPLNIGRGGPLLFGGGALAILDKEIDKHLAKQVKMKGLFQK